MSSFKSSIDRLNNLGWLPPPDAADGIRRRRLQEEDCDGNTVEEKLQPINAASVRKPKTAADTDSSEGTTIIHRRSFQSFRKKF